MQKASRIRAFLRLTRIEHSIMLILAVAAAEIISNRSLFHMPLYILALSWLTPTLISMGSFAINDYYDIEADRANKFTDRPLVSGVLSPKFAFYSSILLLAAGSLLSYFINSYAFAIALAFAILAYLYSYKLKDMPLLGNVYIAFSMAIPFIYGAYVYGFTSIYSINSNIILIVLAIFLSGLAREIHGMMRDIKGDLHVRKTSNVVRMIGYRKSAYLALTLYAEAVAVSIIMAFLYYPFAYNLIYVVLIALTDIMIAYVALGYIIFGKSAKFFRLSRNLSLLAMGIALISYIIAPMIHIYV